MLHFIIQKIIESVGDILGWDKSYTIFYQGGPIYHVAYVPGLVSQPSA